MDEELEKSSGTLSEDIISKRLENAKLFLDLLEKSEQFLTTEDKRTIFLGILNGTCNFSEK